MKKTPLQQALTILSLCTLVGATLLSTSDAWANRYDIQLRGLGRPGSEAVNDPANNRFRLLTSELALALSSRPLQPAETLGVSGFEFFVGTGHANISINESYWQGQPGAPMFEGAIRDRKLPEVLWTPSIHVRKGLPLSTEIGIQGTYLAFSDIFMVGADAKIALHESYWRWFPSIALRGAASTLFGTSDFVITTAEADLLISIPIGINDMVRVDPSLALGMMAMAATSDVIDATPYDTRDQGGGDEGSLYTYRRMKLADNTFKRIATGLHVQAGFIKLVYELNIGIIDFTNKRLNSHVFQIGFDA